MKASRSEACAPLALEGLGTWGLIRAFLRYSQPRWTCTCSNPVLASIQRATFGPLHIPPPGGGPTRRTTLSSARPSSSSNALSLVPGLPWRRSPSPSIPSRTRSAGQSPWSTSESSPPSGPPRRANPRARCARSSASGYAARDRSPCAVEALQPGGLRLFRISFLTQYHDEVWPVSRISSGSIG